MGFVADREQYRLLWQSPSSNALNQPACVSVPARPVKRTAQNQKASPGHTLTCPRGMPHPPSTQSSPAPVHRPAGTHPFFQPSCPKKALQLLLLRPARVPPHGEKMCDTAMPCHAVKHHADLVKCTGWDMQSWALWPRRMRSLQSARAAHHYGEDGLAHIPVHLQTGGSPWDLRPAP